MTSKFDLRVAAVIAAPHWGGLQTVIARTEASLRAAGVARTVIIPPDSVIRARLESAGCDVVEVKLKRLRHPPNWNANTRYLCDFLPGADRLSKLYHEIGADVVEVAGLHHVQPAFAAKSAGLPLAWAMHGTSIPNPFRTIGGLFVSTQADSILTSGQRLARIHGGLANSKTVPFCAPVNLSEFFPDCEKRLTARKALRAGDHNCIVGTLGAFGKVKNHGLLVQVARRLKGRCPNLKFRICGYPVARENNYWQHTVLDQIAQYGLGESGYVEIIEQSITPNILMTGFDIFALPSFAEGLSLATAEAAATGLPLLCSDVGSVPDLVEPGRNGYLFKPTDIDSWSQKILELALHSERREHFSNEARKTAEQKTGVNRCAKDLIRGYQLAYNKYK